MRVKTINKKNVNENKCIKIQIKLTSANPRIVESIFTTPELLPKFDGFLWV